MDAYAVSKHVGYPPRKVRQLADMVRGKKVDNALTLLKFTKRAASEAVGKTIKSAMHNLVNKHGGGSVTAEDMVVKSIIIEEGATMYRIRPRAQGRAYRIRKRSSHIKVTVTLMEEEAATKKPATSRGAK
jgi:large subunit ribosomal protein L22